MYQDTAQDAIKAALTSIEGFESNHTLDAIPDPCVEHCWLVMDFTSEIAAVVWLDQEERGGGINFSMWDEDEWEHACSEFSKHGGQLPSESMS